MRPTSISRDESGVTLIIVSLIIVALLLVAALVVDIGAIRQDRQADRAAADSAVSAGALELGASGATGACATAWATVARALGVSPAPANPCGATFLAACNPNVTRSVTGSIGGATVTIASPVAATDPLMRSETPGSDRVQVADAAYDGDPCTRVGVRIQMSRDPFFGRLAGASSLDSDVHAVARFINEPRPGGEIPALVALDPNGCEVVNAKNGEIIVNPPLGSTSAGVIRTDTLNNSCGSAYVMQVGNASNGLIRVNAAGVLGGGNLTTVATSSAYRPEASSGPITGYHGNRVVASAPITRNPFDLRYRCSTSVVPVGVTRCAGTVDVFNTAIQPLLSGVPTGYSILAGPSCNSPLPVMTGNWYVNCPVFNKSASFLGGGTVIFEGGVEVQSLVFNCGAASPVCSNDKLVIIRGNSPTPALKLQSSVVSLTAPRTTIYQANGNIDMQGGPVVNWTAPTGTFPTKGVLYWNESASTMALGGNPIINSAGVAFVPNSQLSISGNGVIDATRVQFWAKRVEITSGAARFLLQPDPASAIPTTGAVSKLIR